MTHIVAIGGGQAGAALVVKLRDLGFDGKITLICGEPVPPYQRPPLSKAYLLGDMDEARLYLRPQSFYAERNIDLRLGASVSGIDPERKRVVVDGEDLRYDQLVLTTGAAPRVLPASIGGALPGVFTVRSLADVDTMAPYFTAGRRVLIIGGGYIGLEAAAVAALRGLKVTIVEMAERVLQRVAASETSDYFRALHRSHGVTVNEGLGLQQLVGSDHVTGARFTDGSHLDVDFAVVGVGVAPATDMAQLAGLDLDNGIKVDAHGRTSDPHIWAAGDCASFPRNGTRIRLESVQNAIDQAEVVAQNMLGAVIDYRPMPWFWSDQYDVKLQIAGLNTGYDKVIARTTSDPAVRSHWYYAGRTLLAVDAMNDPRSYMIAKRLIEAGRSPAADVIAAPDTDLKALLRG